MGFSSEQGKVCKKHPTHEEKQGVCPSCLRDRLFHLNHSGGGGSVSSFVNRDKAASAHSSASYSACLSNDDYHDTVNKNNSVDNKQPKGLAGEEEKWLGRAHHRNASSSDIGSMSFRAPSSATAVSSGANVGLKKCRSVAASYSFAPQPPKAISRLVDVGGGDGEKKFFSNYDGRNQGYGNYNKSGSGGGGDYGYRGGKKKKGFWTKLLHLKGKNKEVLIHHHHHHHHPAMAMKGKAY